MGKFSCNRQTYKKEKIFYATESDLEESQLFLSGTRISMSDNETIYQICYADLDDEFAPNLNYDTLGEATPILSGDIITGGIVNMYKTDQGWITCSFPTREIHEILHTLSFDHSYEPYWDPYWGYGDLNLHYLKDIMFPYSYCQYQNELNEKYISCLKYIYSNGEVKGNCSEVNFMYKDGERVGECAEGTYITLDGEYCCGEPDMIIDEEGYCTYSEISPELKISTYENIEEFEKMYDVSVELKNDGGIGLAEIDFTETLIDEQTEDEKSDFRWNNMEWLFVKLSKNIEADNYKVIFIMSSDEYTFNYEFISSKENIKNVYTVNFIENIEIDIT